MLQYIKVKPDIRIQTTIFLPQCLYSFCNGGAIAVCQASISGSDSLCSGLVYRLPILTPVLVLYGVCIFVPLDKLDHNVG